MNLTLIDNEIEIHLEPSERFWAFHLSGQISVSVESVRDVQLRCPDSTWNQLRAPGTYVPGLIKAGTYYTTRGREFWYVYRDQGTDQSCLCLDLIGEYYKRIVVGSAMAHQWRSQIQSAL